MSAILTPIGTFFIEHIFMSYDGPKLFSCINSLKQTYLAIWVETFSGGERWFYLPVSPGRLSAIAIGEISLREAYVHPEDGWLWELKFDYILPASSSANLIWGKDLIEADLPDADVYLGGCYSDDGYATVRETSYGRDYLDIVLETT